MDFVETNSEDYEDHVVLIACRNTEINQQVLFVRSSLPIVCFVVQTWKKPSTKKKRKRQGKKSSKNQDPIKSTRNGVVKKASKCKKISILEDEEEEEEEEEKKKKDQLIMKKTTQKDTLIKRKLLIQTDNLRMKSPASGQGLIDSSSESTVKKSQEKRDSALFENFQKSIEKRSKNTSIPLIPTSDEEDTNNSKEEKERENDHESYDSNNNSPLSHFSTKYRNEMESDNPGSPQKVSFSFCEGKILELQEKIDNLQKENQDLRTAMEKTKILYKKAQEKLSSCFIIQQQMKEFLNDEENQSNLQDYSSMFKSEMNCFNSIRTSTPSDCTTSKNSKRSAKDSGFGEIAKVEKKLKTSEEPQKTIKIIFDKKIPHLPNSSGKRFGTKITPIDSTESMMHLRHSYSIPHEEWKALLKQTSESLFCKKLLEALYP
uniref:BEN domain-containing protein n=1 Tax=Trichogramma kaykai TaxID=54128 RepID=A0ABD2XRC6_9HYME